MIGDSFTAASGGVPYSQHWAVLLEKHLKSTVSKQIELIKLGVGGVGTQFELRLWQLEGSKLEADMVILAFCIGNDFTDEQGSLMPRSLFHSFLDGSYVFRLAHNLYRLKGVAHPTEIMNHTQTNSKQQGGYEIKNDLYDPNKPTFTRPAFLDVVSNRMSITQKANHILFTRLFAHLKQVLLFFQDTVVNSNAKFVVMMIPDEYQVYPSLLKEAAHHKGNQPNDYNTDLPQTQLSHFFQENEIASLDLLPTFVEQSENQILYRRQDTHWNIEGNQLAAKMLAEYIANMLNK